MVAIECGKRNNNPALVCNASGMAGTAKNDGSIQDIAAEEFPKNFLRLHSLSPK